MDWSSLLLAALVLALLWLVQTRTGRKSRLPPGPPALPVLGNLHQLDPKAPFKSILKMSETYGPVLSLYLGWQRVVYLVGYEAVKEALVDQADDFVGRGPFPFLLKATRGYGLGISNGERWRTLRRFTLSTLRDFGMGRRGMESWIQEESRHLRVAMETTKGLPFDPSRVLSRTVSNVVCCLVFGRRFSYNDQRFLHLLDIISTVLKFLSSPLGQLYNVFPGLMELLPGPHHAMFSQIQEIQDFIRDQVQEHRDTLDPASPRDFIDSFLLRMDQEKDVPSSEFHQDNLVSTVLNLFLAGTETTSTTIRYGLSVLVRFPHIQERMRAEIDSVLVQGVSPSMEHRAALPYTYAVIHELQRFLDIVPFSLPHYALYDITFRGHTIPKVRGHTIPKVRGHTIPEVRGHTIPKDTMIFPLLHSVLKDDKQWAEPLTFNPQHFLDQNQNFHKNPAFLPFAAGKRSCVGESLARMELFIFLVSLMQHFSFSCSAGAASIDLEPEYSGFANVPRVYRIIATPR